MKILHVFHHSNLVNGVDRTTLTLLRALRRRGEEVFAMVPRVGDVTSALDELGVAYRVADLGCCSGPAKLAELAYLSRAATRAKEIELWIRQEGIDLVHLNTGHLLDAAIAAARAGVASVWHIHSPFEEDLARYAGFMEPKAYAWLLGELGSRVVAVSDDVRASLLVHLPADMVGTLYNGIDIEDLELRSRHANGTLRGELGLSPDIPLVLGIGRISAQKDFAAFTRVAHRVAQVHPDVCFAIAGPAEDQKLSEALRKQVDTLGLARRLFILGARRDAAALLAQSDVFLSTAIFEGHPLTSLEAMALRKPVVAMACVGLRECIRSEMDGLLVPLGDEAACAAAVLRVLEDKPLGAALGERARESVLARYSAAAYAEGFLEVARLARADARPGRNAAAASFALGLLCEIREAHERLMRATRSPKTIGERLRARLPSLFNQKP